MTVESASPLGRLGSSGYFKVIPSASGDTDIERDARFTPGNDAIWGEGNWVRCSTCPRDNEGREVYHHRNAHAGG